LKAENVKVKVHFLLIFFSRKFFIIHIVVIVSYNLKELLNIDKPRLITMKRLDLGRCRFFLSTLVIDFFDYFRRLRFQCRLFYNRDFDYFVPYFCDAFTVDALVDPTNNVRVSRRHSVKRVITPIPDNQNCASENWHIKCGRDQNVFVRVFLHRTTQHIHLNTQLGTCL
jgi:hypothetical protein